MTDHPNARDYASKAERAEQEATEAWACADRLADTLELIAQTTMSTFKNPTHMAQVQKQWAIDALAAYREKRG